MSSNPSTQNLHPLIQYLTGLVKDNDRGALAALRRGLGKAPGETPEMYPHVMRFNPSPWEEDNYFLVASLFALWHQGSLTSTPGQAPANIGESYRRVAGQTDSESIERRFVALLNAHRQDLPDHLRHAVSLMRGAKQPVPVNWNELLRDLRRWDFERRPTQRRWARGFWGQTDQANQDGIDESSLEQEEGNA